MSRQNGYGEFDMSLEAEILSVSLERCDYTQASGAASNNKIVVEKLLVRPYLMAQIVESLNYYVELEGIDHVISIPRGGDPLAGLVANKTGIGVTYLTKDKQGSFHLMPGDKEKIEASEEAAAIDDVTTQLTNYRRMIEMLRTQGIKKEINKLLTVVDRGPVDRESLDVRILPVLRKPIAPMLEPNDLLWQFAEGKGTA